MVIIAAGRRARTQGCLGACAVGHGFEGPFPQVSPLFGTIYDAVVLLAHALNRSEGLGAGLSGARLGHHTGALDVAGFSQRIRTDEKGRRLAQYVILDTDGRESQLVPTHILDTGTWQVRPLDRAIHFPGGAPPARDSSCWFDPNTRCMRGNSPTIHPPFIHPSLIKALHGSSSQSREVQEQVQIRDSTLLRRPNHSCDGPGKASKGPLS